MDANRLGYVELDRITEVDPHCCGVVGRVRKRYRPNERTLSNSEALGLSLGSLVRHADRNEWNLSVHFDGVDRVGG